MKYSIMYGSADGVPATGNTNLSGITSQGVYPQTIKCREVHEEKQAFFLFTWGKAMTCIIPRQR